MDIDLKYIPLYQKSHENRDLVLGIKNVFELEGVINSQDCCFTFLNRSLPHFSKRAYHAETRGTKVDQGKSTIHR